LSLALSLSINNKQQKKKLTSLQLQEFKLAQSYRGYFHFRRTAFVSLLKSSDYLDDNPMKKHFSGKDLSIFSFILRWNVRL
jgi:hypothetical protein